MIFSNGLFKSPGVLVVALAVVVCFFIPSVSRSQGEMDPSDLWYRGFLLVQAARESEAQGQYLAGFNQLGEAKQLYDHLAREYPEYLKEIVTERRHLIAEKRDELTTLMRQPKAPVAPAPRLMPQQQAPQSYAGNPQGQPGNGVPGVRIAPPPSNPGGARSRSMEIETGRETSLPSWTEGASRALPRQGEMVGPNAPSLPRVDTRPPNSVSGIANSFYNDISRNDKHIELLNKENDELRREIASTNLSLEDVTKKLLNAHRRADALERERDEIQANGGGNFENAKKLAHEAVEELKRVNGQNEMLVTELEKSKIREQRFRDRIAEVERERDSLLEVVQGGGNGGKALKELMDRNRELSAKLDRAEQLASSLSELNNEKDADIKMLRSQITQIQLERDKLLSENLRHQQSIDDSLRKLELLSEGLTAEDRNALANSSPIERRENEMLRSVVLKQLRREAQKKAAKDLLLKQLEKTGVRSETLLSLIDDMVRGSQLTDEEKALFRSPQFQEIVDAASTDDVEAVTAFSDAANPSGDGSGATMTATLVGPGSAPALPGANGVIEKQKLSVELSQIDKSARLDFKEGRYSEAEDGFLDYLRYRPKNVGCLCNLGVLKISMKNYSEAEYYLERALAIESKSGLANYLLGRTLFLQGKLDDALAKLEEGLTYDPQNAKAHNSVGVISTQKGWVDRAERAFTNAVSIDPEYGDAHFNLAVLFATKEQPDPKAAEKHYFRALHLGIPRDSQIEGFLQEAEAAGLTVGVR